MYIWEGKLTSMFTPSDFSFACVPSSPVAAVCEALLFLGILNPSITQTFGESK